MKFLTYVRLHMLDRTSSVSASVAFLPTVLSSSSALFTPWFPKRNLQITRGQLPEVLDESKWMANRMTFDQMLSHSRSKASEERCRTRLDDPPEVCKQLLIDLREGPALWQGLRKHLTVEDTEFVLRMLQEHSDWKTVKKRSEWKTPKGVPSFVRRMQTFWSGLSTHRNETADG